MKTIRKLMKEQKMTVYRLSKNSGVPYTTVSDICKNKTDLVKCNAETVYRLASALGVTMDDLIAPQMDRCPSFELFKSSTCHQVKELGDTEFIIQVLEQDEIRNYFDKEWYEESLYLLGMLDYLSRENKIPLCDRYDDIRKRKLSKPKYPLSIHALAIAFKSDEPYERAYRESIPEFVRFNIIENEVRNVV